MALYVLALCDAFFGFQKNVVIIAARIIVRVTTYPLLLVVLRAFVIVIYTAKQVQTKSHDAMKMPAYAKQPSRTFGDVSGLVDVAGL